MEKIRPDIQLRISRRARRVQLRVLPSGQVEVVVPVGFDQQRIPQLVEKQGDWLKRARNKVLSLQMAHPESHGLVPGVIQLHAIAETWKIRYGVRLPGRTRYESSHSEGENTLLLRPLASPHTISPVLQQWLTHQAKWHLIPLLQQISEELSLPFNKVSIRAQKTRWGSCSANKNINLNRNLMLLPPQLVRHLIIHELCHTRHLNHSSRFWALVARHASDYRQHERQLREAAAALPLWVHV